MTQIFVSYARGDRDFAEQIYNDLLAQGFKLWLDLRSIPSGSNWDAEVQKGLDTSDMMLVALSPKSVASQNVADEWSYFIEKGKTVVPLLIKPCDVPFRLSRRQRIDFTQEYRVALGQLMAALSAGGAPEASAATRPAPTSAPTSGPTRPEPAKPTAGRPGSPARATGSTPEVSVKMMSAVWGNTYNWFNGLRDGGQAGQILVNSREMALVPRDQPLTVIPLKSLVSVRLRRSIDSYLQIMYYGADGGMKSFVLMGSPKARRNTVNREVLNILRLRTGRSLS